MKNLRVLRTRRGLKQEEVAEFLGVSRGTYSRYETSEIVVSSEIVKRLSIFFNVSTDYLLGNINFPLPLDYIKKLQKINSKDLDFLLNKDQPVFNHPIKSIDQNTIDLLNSLSISELRKMLKIIRALNSEEN